MQSVWALQIEVQSSMLVAVVAPGSSHSRRRGSWASRLDDGSICTWKCGRRVRNVIDVVPAVPNKRVANKKSVLDASNRGYSVCEAGQVSEEVEVDLVVVVVAVLGADDMLVAVFDPLLSERVLVAVGNDIDELDESNTERVEVPLILDEDEVLCVTECNNDEDDRLCENEISRIEVVDELLLR
ncbi:hypothetical protein KCU85_g9946, partial [Aureobasidium melanogenum]